MQCECQSVSVCIGTFMLIYSIHWYLVLKNYRCTHKYTFLKPMLNVRIGTGTLPPTCAPYAYLHTTFTPIPHITLALIDWHGRSIG